MKSQLIEGKATVIAKGTTIVGCMAWETPYITFDFRGNKYEWVSENAHIPKVKIGEDIVIRAFVRYGTGNLFRVTFPCGTEDNE